MASYSEENPHCLLNSEQHFLVSVTIYKARHLKILNSDTFVMVSLNGKYKRTKTASRTENPYFNEYFAFELHCSEKVLLRKTLHFILYRSSIYTSLKSSLGEFTVDLRTVWNQKDHAVFKKWATFEPIGRAASSDLNRGYLLIDIAISSSLENPVPVVFSEFDFDDIESNKLLPYDSKNEPRRVRYCCNIFSGDFKISDEYVVCISFAGLSLIVLLEHLDAQRDQDMVVSKELLVSLTSDVEMAFDSTLNMVSNSVYRKSTKWDQMRKMHTLQQLGQHKATVTTLKSQMFSEIDSDEVKRMQSELNHIKTSISQIGHDVNQRKHTKSKMATQMCYYTSAALPDKRR
ncbi:otoferlin-like [Anopheles ziemanni]|uniref:otoferlin-like n=1 Tax=Anopheles coustani TaxID=139045 RepID=UPI0026595293|nr:otoferlin-like [Anopheles coustani]XP_058177869.1 otoferlin-like [Anopheles ziemanni]